MLVGINEAARLTGKSKSVIHKHTKDGSLSSQPDATGKRKYQLAELERVYGLLPQEEPENHAKGTSPNQSEPRELFEKTFRTSDLEAALKAKEEVISTLKDQIEDLKIERDRWHKAFEEVKMLPAPANDAEKPKKRFFGLF